MTNTTETALRCLNDHDGSCKGKVEWHLNPDRSDFKTFARCEYHQGLRLDQAERNMRDFPDSPIAPSWFDPANAGEHWNDDY